MNKGPKSINSMPTVNNGYCPAHTEQNIRLDESQKVYSSYYAQTECNRENFLDYTFLSHRDLICNKKTKDPKKIRDYNYDLEQTLEINLDLLSKIDFPIKDSSINNELRKMINNIKEKNEKRRDKINKIKEQKNLMVNKKQVIVEMNKKFDENNEIYENKYNEESKVLKEKKNYISIINQRFKDVQTYINNLELLTKNRKPRPNMSQFIKENNHFYKEKKMLSLDIKKLTDQISEIKKENQIYKEESALYRNKNTNKELIRVVEFYRRIIRALQTKIKILKNAFENMTKTLNYLNLGDSKFNFLKFFSCQFQHQKKRSQYDAL